MEPSSPPAEPRDAAGPAVQDLPAPAVAADRLATRIDDLVPVADDAANRVLTDRTPIVRWAGLLFTVCALLLVPWIVVIAVTLPARQLSPNYDVAWAGFDVMLLAALTATAACAFRRSTYLALAAASAGALLVVDAWFDVLTSPSGRDRAEGLAMAVLVELPLAAVCAWLAVHTQEIADRRLRLLLRRARRPAGGAPDGRRDHSSP